MVMAETFRVVSLNVRTPNAKKKKKSTGNSKSVFAGINGSAWSEPLVCVGGGDFDVRSSKMVVPRFICAGDHVAWEPRKRRSPMCVKLAIDIVGDGVLICR